MKVIPSPTHLFASQLSRSSSFPQVTPLFWFVLPVQNTTHQAVEKIISKKRPGPVRGSDTRDLGVARKRFRWVALDGMSSKESKKLGSMGRQHQSAVAFSGDIDIGCFVTKKTHRHS